MSVFGRDVKTKLWTACLWLWILLPCRPGFPAWCLKVPPSERFRAPSCALPSMTVTAAELSTDDNATENSTISSTSRETPDVRKEIAWINNWAYGCDFPGNDLGSVRVTGRQCGRTCDVTPGCTHFTWTTFEGGTCTLKHGHASKTDAVKINAGPNDVCGVAPPLDDIVWHDNYAHKCDFPGNDLGQVRVSGIHCSEVCQARAECTHFTWTELHGGNCILKRGPVSKAGAVAKRGSSRDICGIV